MAKLVKISDTKAYRIEGIEINKERYVSIRQYYATSKEPTLKPGKQGVTLPISHAMKIAKYLSQIAEGDEFKSVNFDK